jgi:hypothetical protein
MPKKLTKRTAQRLIESIRMNIMKLINDKMMYTTASSVPNSVAGLLKGHKEFLRQAK